MNEIVHIYTFESGALRGLTQFEARMLRCWKTALDALALALDNIWDSFAIFLFELGKTATSCMMGHDCLIKLNSQKYFFSSIWPGLSNCKIS